MNHPENPKTVPVVAASMAMPFANFMRRYAKNPDASLVRFGLVPGQLTDDVIIPAQAWYDFVSAAASEVEDPHFGYKVGQENPLESLPNFDAVRLASATLGEILTALLIDSERILTHSEYQIVTRANAVRIEAFRKFRPKSPPAQIDGFFMGFLLKLFRKCVPEEWSPNEVIITVCDPTAFPASVSQQCTILRGQDTGTVIQFPTRWMLARTDQKYSQTEIGKAVLDHGFLEQVRDLIRGRLSDPDISEKEFAQMCACSVSTLQARLKTSGTTYSSELKKLRAETAKRLLRSDSIPISAIGEAVGYPDPTAFSRAFRNWTGLSPREYRKLRS